MHERLPPRTFTNEDIISPPLATKRADHNHNLRQTLYIPASFIKDKIGPQWLPMNGIPKFKDIQLYLENDRSTFIGAFARKVVETDGYRLFSNARDNGKNDLRILESVAWVDYFLGSVDPVYLQSEINKLDITLNSKRQIAAGFYSTYANLVFLHSDNAKKAEMSMFERRTLQEVLVHELAHHTHLGTEPLAYDCGEHLCKNIQKHSDEFVGSVMTSKMRKEVDLVLFFGYKSDFLSYEEAVLVNKIILNNRIIALYQAALDSTLYEPWKAKYAMTNKDEFWAEATRTFFTRVHVETRFPTRTWVKKNDPALYDLLLEVYPGAV